MERTSNSSSADVVEAFITRWHPSGGAERANYQLFLSELCDALGVSRPDPAKSNDYENVYIFERSVIFENGDGTTSPGSIDLYKRGCFVLETKQGVEKKEAAQPLSQAERQRRKKRRKGHGVRGSGTWDTALTKARGQAEGYVRALPAEEGRPPFVAVVDVGYCIDLFSEFTRTGGNYVPFPDPRSHRILLEHLRRDEVQERLRVLWTDPMALDPSRRSARVTRDIADRLARLAKSLEASGHRPKAVANFLMRCLFTMFAEDVGLLPECAFTELLRGLRSSHRSLGFQPKKLGQDGQATDGQATRSPATVPSFKPTVEELWRTMNTGGFSVALRETLLRFNGGLFAEYEALDVTLDQLELLVEAAEADWRDVEPAIFGTLLERALDPDERHKLGAHYTPRAYVERLVLPTIVEPLRDEWAAVQTAVSVTLARAESVEIEAQDLRERARQGDTAAKQSTKAHELESDARKLREQAADELSRFHGRLCKTKILDPACGSGNFLYVSLEHLKRLEGEVLVQLRTISREAIDLIEGEGITVDPHQLLGLEINPRAAAITELVLWIGYLQWHYRTHGDINPPEPVIKDFHNIECRDAVLAYDGERIVIDPETNQPVTRWDGKTYKKHPVTGEDVPDESARVPLREYTNPRPAQWPEADFVVGNPPFIGTALMRQALGDGYTETLRRTIDEVPESSDYVMYWWNHAAHLARKDAIRRFGFIATNSLRQTFNRRVLEPHLHDKKKPLSLVFAIPDHPWVDAADGAAVRISMTAGEGGQRTGILSKVIAEATASGHGDSVLVELSKAEGQIHPDLTTGADVSSSASLKANSELSCRGVQLIGAGFIVTPEQARDLGLGRIPGLERHIRQYRNGRDLSQRPRDVMVIDLFGLAVQDLRQRFPEVYQWVHERVKPERDQNNRKSYRENWWIFGEPRGHFRPALKGLHRYIATVETSKHRFFVFLDESILPDNKLVNIALDDAYSLGVLSSRIHVTWALAAGGRLGVGNDPCYNKTRCFETFPFPEATEGQQVRICELGEALDAHRKRQQAQHPRLTMTAMYNVLDTLRAIEGEQPRSLGFQPKSSIDNNLGAKGLGQDGQATDGQATDGQATDGQATGKNPDTWPTAFDAKRPIEKREGAFLPHWTQQETAYFVTFRLGDSLPQAVAQQWCQEREALLERVAMEEDPAVREGLHQRVKRLFTEKFDRLLDNGRGSCCLREDGIAEIVANALRHFDDERYRLWAFCVMPNHVHAVVEPLGKHGLPDIMHSWKSYTGNRINAALGRTGALWQQESFDHVIRSQSDFERYIDYTIENPSNAGLADWPWVGSRSLPFQGKSSFDNASKTGELGLEAQATLRSLPFQGKSDPERSIRLTSKEQEIHEQGLVSVLKELHDDLDAAVFDAYGWAYDLTDEEILERLVALNAERATEERQGIIRWLRPAFQCPEGAVATQTEAEEPVAVELQPPKKRSWPKALAEQAQAVRTALTAFNRPATAEEVARSFKRARTDRVAELLETLASLGQCRALDGGRYVG